MNRWFRRKPRKRVGLRLGSAYADRGTDRATSPGSARLAAKATIRQAMHRTKGHAMSDETIVVTPEWLDAARDVAAAEALKENPVPEPVLESLTSEVHAMAHDIIRAAYDGATSHEEVTARLESALIGVLPPLTLTNLDASPVSDTRSLEDLRKELESAGWTVYIEPSLGQQPYGRDICTRDHWGCAFMVNAHRYNAHVSVTFGDLAVALRMTLAAINAAKEAN